MTKEEKQLLNIAVEQFKVSVYVENSCFCDDCLEERSHRAINKILKQWKLGDTLPAYYNRYSLLSHYTIIIKNLLSIKSQNDYIREQYKKKRLYFCNYCGVLHTVDNNISLGKYNICINCQRYAILCSECGTLSVKEKSLSVKNGYICKSCSTLHSYILCNSCNFFCKAQDVTQYPYKVNQNGDPISKAICESCNSSDNQTKCCSCGNIFPKSIMYRFGQTYEHSFCPECRDDEIGMHQYYYKPLKIRYKISSREGKVEPTDFHMGFELEIANDISFLSPKVLGHIIKEKFGKDELYCVHDGTIARATNRDGLEIVSHPFTWRKYKEEYIHMCDDLLLFLRSKGWKANYKGVGFHVHTTKAAWGTLQIFKLLKLIYNNSSFTIQIAQRSPNDYCRMENLNSREIINVAKDKKNREAHHYNAINLNKGNGASSHTIEFRMFQGTLEPLFFHKNIEFVHACYEYTKNNASTKSSSFINWIDKHKKVYPCLNEFMIWKGIK